ncbi:IscS subfamily cysteine desulfurase [Halalkalibacillus halophilus]|uniref:IscS subfamily cysteine desulfurase n=1 Tax=Halalkalibacillus halophilus TaxID=392827 RepID=UPI000688AE4C|nr:IscS subfamily cysteine desulfurase [Halalkalibacillus halophilus]
MIYLDYAATTPISETALHTYNEVANNFFANSNSLHDYGDQANQVYSLCMKNIGEILNAKPDNIYFTNGGSESNLIAIDLLLSLSDRREIIVSKAEHNSVHQAMSLYETKGYEIKWIEFGKNYIVNMKKLNELVSNNTALVVLQHVNGEIGTIQPVEEVSELCQRNGAYFHIDAVQSFGQVNCNHLSSLATSFSLSGHKIYGPKGIGLLYFNEEKFDRINSFSKIVLEGNTTDLPTICAFTTALEEADERRFLEEKRLKDLRIKFIHQINNIKDLSIIEGKEDIQVPSIVGLSIKYIEGQYMMLECNRKGFAISTGSACDVKYQSYPKIVEAIEGEDLHNNFFRVSFGRLTTEEDLSNFSIVMNEICHSSILNRR